MNSTPFCPFCELSSQGKRWKDKSPLTLPMQHPADLTVLSEKCLLMTYGIRNRGLMGIGVRISIDGGTTWRPPWVIHQFGPEAKDIGYPSTVLLDKKGNLMAEMALEAIIEVINVVEGR